MSSSHITADMGTLGAEALGPAKADVTVANRAAGMIKFGMIKFVRDLQVLP